MTAWADELGHSWSQCFGGTGRQGCTSMAVDGSGAVLLTGSFLGTLDFGGGPLTSVGDDRDIFLAKFDPDGKHLYSRRFGDSAYQNAISVAVDATGHVLLTGHFWGTVDFGGGPLTSAGSSDIFLTKLDPHGNHVWSRRFGDSSSGGSGHDVAVDSSGDVLLTGQFSGTVDFGGGPLESEGLSDVYMVKFDASGNHLWSRRFGDGDFQHGSAVAVDTSGNVVITGYFMGQVDFGGGLLVSLENYNIFLASFDASGNHTWSQGFGDASGQYSYDVVADDAGSVFLTGEFFGSMDFGGGPLTSAGNTDVFLAKFDLNGHHQWSQRFGDSSWQEAFSVAPNGSGDVLLTGGFMGSVDFGGGPLTSAGPFPELRDDIFLAKFDSDGNHVLSERFGDSNRQWGRDVVVSGSGDVLLTGYFSGEVDFGGGPLSSVGSYDNIFMVKFLTGPMPLALDIKPGSCPNTLNPRSQGVFPAAILGSAHMNVGDIDASSVSLEGMVAPFHTGIEDVSALIVNGDLCDCTTEGPDGHDDLTLRFRTADVCGALGQLAVGDVHVLTITGQLQDGTPFEARDCVEVRGQPRGTAFGRRRPEFHSASLSPNIQFTLADDSRVRVAVYDVSGRLIRELADDFYSAGQHRLVWDGADSGGRRLASGVYFARLESDREVWASKLVLVR